MSKMSSERQKNGRALRHVQQLARRISEKKGEGILIFDLRGLSPIADFFVVAHGLSTVHNRTIAQYLVEDEEPSHLEGHEAGNWILLDYFDIIVHIFLKETREFYGLERLWGDAPHVAWEDD